MNLVLMNWKMFQNKPNKVFFLHCGFYFNHILTAVYCIGGHAILNALKTGSQPHNKAIRAATPPTFIYSNAQSGSYANNFVNGFTPFRHIF